MSDLRTIGLSSLEFARQATLKLLEGLPEQGFTHQPVAGGNHVLWVLGHLAATDDFFLTRLANRESGLPQQWGALFGMGSTPTSDAAAYPSREEVLQRLAERREALVQWFRSLSDADLARTLPDDFSEFAPDYASLPTRIAWHEGLHAGQISTVRKSLGLKPAFG